MLSPSLSTETPTRTRRAKRAQPLSAHPEQGLSLSTPASKDQPPAHLNFSFDEWFKANTELPRQASGWTPAARLYADYLAFCAATGVPASYHLNDAAFAERMRAACDRSADMRKVSEGTKLDYRLCWPRFLRPAIRVPS